MRIVVAAVGRARGSEPEQAMCDSYAKRAAALGARLGFSKLDFVVVDVSRHANAQARVLDEAETLSRRLPNGAHRIVLDEAGRQLSSEAFAGHLAALRDRGTRDVAFIIGGPDGVAPSLREGAEERLAFGTQTWPHLMVRTMLAEQIYRAFAILSGHPYHRGRL